MNGLLGWALEEIGFEVMYMSGGVARSTRGDSALGNHLVLLARLMARSD
jgi:arylamine N-acetyltransferase